MAAADLAAWKLTLTQKFQFWRNGFLLLPDVLSQEQVRGLREFLVRIYDVEARRPGDDDVTRYDVICRYPEARWLVGHPPLVGALKSLLGNDFAFLHEWSAHDSYFGGWHKDTTGQETNGKLFHYAADYRMVQVAIYLQDNGEYGGGVDVIPGTHRERTDRYVRTGAPPKLTFWQRAWRKLRHYGLLPAEKERAYSIPSRAGDVVIFHTRACHQATQPKTTPVPPEYRKLAIFLMASANNEHARTYMDWCKGGYGSAVRPHLVGDHTFDPEVVRLAQENQFKLVG